MSAFSRKQIQASLLCYTAFLLYATLWPFDFHFAQGIATPHKISWIPFFDPVGGPGRRDALMNVLVFLPFGFLSFLKNSASGKMHRPVLLATLLGAALSFSVEAAQIGLPSRNPSTSDLLMNATGALLGALSARALQRKIRSDPERFRLLIRRNAVPLAATTCALALLASTIRTFDPILSWRVVGIRAAAFVGSPLLPDHLDLDYSAWMVLSFGFLAFLIAEVFAGSSMIRRRLACYVGAFVTCSLFAVALEALQILFRSRHPLLSHALLGVVGVAYGIVWHAIGRFGAASTSAPIQAGSRTASMSYLPLAIPLFFSHYVLLLILAFLSPIPHSIGSFRFELRGVIPLFFYLREISMPSLYAAVKTIVLYIPVGIMLYLGPDTTQGQTWKRSLGLAIGIQTLIEIGRGFSGHQFPDPSNLFLAALGAYGGALLAKHIRTPWTSTAHIDIT